MKVLSSMMTTAAETEKEMQTHGREDLATKERLLKETILGYLNIK